MYVPPEVHPSLGLSRLSGPGNLGYSNPDQYMDVCIELLSSCGNIYGSSMDIFTALTEI